MNHLTVDNSYYYIEQASKPVNIKKLFKKYNTSRNKQNIIRRAIKQYQRIPN